MINPHTKVNLLIAIAAIAICIFCYWSNWTTVANLLAALALVQCLLIYKRSRNKGKTRYHHVKWDGKRVTREE